MAFFRIYTPSEATGVRTDFYIFDVAPGGRPILVVKSDVPVNISIFTAKEFEKARPPSIFASNVIEIRIAMPSDAGERYVLLSSRPVEVVLKPGSIADTTSLLRRGVEVERVYVKFVGRVGDKQSIPRVAPGVVLAGRTDGEICLVDDLSAKPSDCYSGEFRVKFDEFKDVYLVVTKPGLVEYAVYATQEMLLALGTCG